MFVSTENKKYIYMHITFILSYEFQKSAAKITVFTLSIQTPIPELSYSL